MKTATGTGFKKACRAIHYAPCNKVACGPRADLAVGTLDEFLALREDQRCSRCMRTAQKHLEMRARKAAKAAGV